MPHFSPDSAFFERISTEPGVYVMKDRAGKVIYVGKAKSLRNRVRQYFRAEGDARFFVATGLLGSVLNDIETILVTNEKEALLLENHLIKTHQPRFNVKLRDDKQYLVLRIDPKARFPRVEVVRNIKDDGARYFGPYHSATSCRDMLRTLNRHFQLRTCSDHVLNNRTRPCLQYQIKRCLGPCVFPVEETTYSEQVEEVMLFLAGQDQELEKRLNLRMQLASDAENFERAAELRDSVKAVRRTLAKQVIVQKDFVDQDVIGLHREGDRVHIAFLYVRAGKLVDRRIFREKEQESEDSQVVRDVLVRYYDSGTVIPNEILLPCAIEDTDVMTEWLRDLRQGAVRIVTPERGVKNRLLELARKNAESAASALDADAERIASLSKLAERLSLKKIPTRIECFDIAHLQGSETVASMAVFIGGKAASKEYRRFKVKGSGNDDFASMYEVIKRRFARSLSTENQWPWPDLVVIDGGQGQLRSALAAIADLGIPSSQLDVVGLAKDREDSSGQFWPDRVFLQNAKEPIVPRRNSPELYILSQVRDEAHRFANTFHKKRRSARTLRSELANISGIGATLQKRLLTHFGSVAGVKAASREELLKVAGVNSRVAMAIANHFVGVGSNTVSAEQSPSGKILGEVQSGIFEAENEKLRE